MSELKNWKISYREAMKMYRDERREKLDIEVKLENTKDDLKAIMLDIENRKDPTPLQVYRWANELLKELES